MAGLNSRKLSGVRAKFWADLELFLNTAGLRVKSGRSQGLFNKISRPKGYVLIWALGSRSDGSDSIWIGSNPVR